MTTVRRTHRWRGAVALALLLGSLGLVAKRPFLLLAATVGVGYAVYPRLFGSPPVDLAIDRRLDVADPSPGEEVEVTVTVTNRGARTLFDVRIVDGVPSMVEVSDGPARHAAVLRPGASTTFSYGVRAAHGSHRFRPATVVVRDLPGGTEVETTVADESELVCRATDPERTVRPVTTATPGAVAAETPGSGVEFAQRRAYQSGDALGRVDWTHLAKTGELATVEYTEERDVSVVVCVDARPESYCGQGDEPNAVAHGIGAATTLIDGYHRATAAVGLAAIGRDLCWQPPRRRADVAPLRATLGTHPTLSAVPPERTGDAGGPDAGDQLRLLRNRLEPDDQVAFVTPLTDEFACRATTRLDAGGTPVTVVSPDVTDTSSLGGRVAAAERRHRIARLQRAGVVVADWEPAEPLALAMNRLRGRP